MYCLFSIALFIVAIATKEIEYLYASGLFAIGDSILAITRHLDKKN